MTFVYGFLAGIAFWYLMHRILMSFGFERIRKMHKETFRKEILGKAGYDDLMGFKDALEAEIGKRREAV